MGTVARIFTRDLKRILRNPVAVLVTLGVALIPALYAWFNVAASWDPYGNTENIKVAVVNDDEGTTSDLVGTLDAGQLVVDALGENDQLGWTFSDNAGQPLTEEAALSGVEDGTYYAALVIPEGFSADLASLATGDFQKPSIGYYINEKRNTVVPEIADIGASTVENQITEQFVSTVSQVVAEKVQGVGGSLADDAEALGSDVAGEVRAVATSLSDASGLVDSLDGSVDEAQAALASAKTSLDSLATLAEGANGALDDATALLGTTRSTARSLTSELSDSLGQGGSLLAGVSGQANTALGTLTGKVSAATGAVDGALATAQGVLDANKSLADALSAEVARLDQIPELSGRLGDLQVAADQLQRTVASQQAVVDTLSKTSSDVRTSANALAGASASVNDAVVGGVSDLSDLRAQLDQTSLPSLTAALDSFGDVSGDLKGILGGLGPTISQAQAVLDQLSTTLDQTRGVTDDLTGSLGSLSSQLSGVATDMETLSAAVSGQLDDLLDLDPQGVSDFMTSPVELASQTLFPVEKYGASAAPFYTNLAIWVGGFVLVAIYKQEVDPEGLAGADGAPLRVRPWQGYLGRLALFLLVGQLQAVVVCVGDVAMGMQCANPAAFVFAGMVQSLVYVSLIFAVAVAFKHIGKALAVVLVILQIPGSSGLYPIEMMPGFFQAVEPWLPFTYGIRAMREAVAGFYGNHYAVALLTLLAFLIPALVVGLGCRRRLVGVNALFDRRLSETGLMVADCTSAVEPTVSLSAVARTLSQTDDYADELARRTSRFEALYPRLVRAGKLLLALVPAGLLILLFLLKDKLPVLILWICSVVAICAYLIVLEYLHNVAVRVGDGVPLSRSALGTERLARCATRGEGHPISDATQPSCQTASSDDTIFFGEEDGPAAPIRPASSASLARLPEQPGTKSPEGDVGASPHASHEVSEEHSDERRAMGQGPCAPTHHPKDEEDAR